jgi:hypothetical protein
LSKVFLSSDSSSLGGRGFSRASVPLRRSYKPFSIGTIESPRTLVQAISRNAPITSNMEQASGEALTGAPVNIDPIGVLPDTSVSPALSERRPSQGVFSKFGDSILRIFLGLLGLNTPTPSPTTV